VIRLSIDFGISKIAPSNSVSLNGLIFRRFEEDDSSLVRIGSALLPVEVGDVGGTKKRLYQSLQSVRTA